VFVSGEASVQEGDFFGGEGSGRALGFGFDGVDLADRVDGDGAVADGEFHGARDDGAAGPGSGCAGMVLDAGENVVEAWGGGFADVEFADSGANVVVEGAPVGVQRGWRSGAVGDQSFEPSLPEVQEVVDLVHLGEFGGVVGLGAVLEFGEQGGSRGGLGGSGGGDGADFAVVVPESGVCQVFDGLAVLLGLHGPGGDLSPGSDGQRCPRHGLPPTDMSVTCSTLSGCGDRRGRKRRARM
jgi:hypothetical protein